MRVDDVCFRTDGIYVLENIDNILIPSHNEDMIRDKSYTSEDKYSIGIRFFFDESISAYRVHLRWKNKTKRGVPQLMSRYPGYRTSKKNRMLAESSFVTINNYGNEFEFETNDFIVNGNLKEIELFKKSIDTISLIKKNESSGSDYKHKFTNVNFFEGNSYGHEYI